MKYIYIYKTSDGTRHEASMSAESREAVFTALRAKGIKAIKVVAADGSKANGEVRGIRKRMVALMVLIAAAVAGVGVFFWTEEQTIRPLAKDEASPLPRQEIKGSRERIEAAKEVFETKAELFLARFVEPGRAVSVPESEWPSKADFEKVLRKPVKFAENEFTEQIDVKRIVEWLKREMAYYLRGGGYVSGYIKDLLKRQQMEVDERVKAQKRLSEFLQATDRRHPEKPQKDAYEYWLKANARLQSMGIYLLPLPSQLTTCSSSATLDD